MPEPHPLPPQLNEPERLRQLLGSARRAARTVTTDTALVDDAAQHALELLLRRCTTEDSIPTLAWSAWVQTTAHRYTRDQLRKAGRDHPAGLHGSALPGQGQHAFEAPPGHAPGIGTLIAQNHADQEYVNGLIALLGRRNARIFLAKYHHGHTVRQIAETEQITERAVERRLDKARRAFKEVQL